MAMTLKEIEREISTLDDAEKGELLRRLIAELEPAVDSDVKEAWRLEAERRHVELEKGIVDAVPSDEVMRKARDRLKNVS